jgi:hypothetical protein
MLCWPRKYRFILCVQYTHSLIEQVSNYWIRNLLKKLKLPQPDKISATPHFNESRKCIISFTNSAICPYPGLDDKSSQLSHIPVAYIHFNIILPLTSRSSKWSLSFGLHHQIPCEFLFSTLARPARYSQFNLTPLSAIDSKELRPII